MKANWNLVGCAAALLMLATGCGSMKVSPAYTTAKKGPLSEIPPAKVALAVSDERPAAELKEIGRLYNAFGGVALKFESIPAVTNVIRDTLKAELEANGHRIVEAAEAPDVKMNVAVQRFFYECKPKMWDVEVVVTTIGKMDISRGGKNAPPVTVSATHQKSRQLVGRGSHVKIMNDGLAEFARATSFDPNVQEALRGEVKAAAKQ